MKVSELIEILKQHDPEMEVITRGYEWGYDPIEQAKVIGVQSISRPVDYAGDYENGAERQALLLSLTGYEEN